MFYMFFWACASNGPATAPAVTSPSPHPVDKPETQIQEAAPIPPKSQEAPLVWTLDSFQKPESVLIDFKTSRLWVSNIIGQPTEKDGKGTILELSLDGKLLTQNFTTDLTLHAPKGMCILDDAMYIADIDVVHVVSVHTGAHRYDVPIEGAEFLNDMVCSFNEAYVSDSSTGRIHRIYKEGKAELVVDLSPAKPNGLAFQGVRLFVADFASSTVSKLKPTGEIETQWTVPKGGLDGIAVLRDRSIVVSSWEGQGIYRISQDGTLSTLASDLIAPADFAVDQRHNQLLVPQLTENQISLIPLAWPAEQK